FASAIPGSKSQLIWTKRSTITTHGGTSVVSSQSSFAKRVAQLLLGRFNFAGCFLAKQDGAEFFSLIIACDESFLRVDPGKIDTSWLGTKVADKIHVQVKHLRPKVRNLLVADPFFAGHISAGDQPLFPRVVPMRLAPHATHHTVWIKCEVADCVDSLFFCLEVVRDRRSMRSGKRRVTNQIEIRLCAAGDHGQACWHSVTASVRDLAKDGFPFRTIKTFAHQHRGAVFCEIFRQPSARFSINITIQ